MQQTTLVFVGVFSLSAVLAVAGTGAGSDDRLFAGVLALLSALGLGATLFLIPRVRGSCLKAGMSGCDLNKCEGPPPPNAVRVPESLGIVVGTVFLVCGVLLQPVFARGAAAALLGTYAAGLLSVCLMLLLGFADDVLEVRWRYKILLSALATLPLLASYTGSTDVLLPRFVQTAFGCPAALHLGGLYHVALAMICIFCTNGINIYAGVNGLEAGQAAVIAIFEAFNSALEIAGGRDFGGFHRLAIAVSAPFAACTLGLLRFNWYPSAVFVGDSFTYFAGMTIAVSGVLGHFTKTLMLLFVPQLVNFALSLPQLFGIVPCPRHRLPRFRSSTGKLEAVWPEHLNLINLVLRITGPLTERTLAALLIGLQVFCCAFALLARYTVLSHLFSDE